MTDDGGGSPILPGAKGAISPSVAMAHLPHERSQGRATHGHEGGRKGRPPGPKKRWSPFPRTQKAGRIGALFRILVAFALAAHLVPAGAQALPRWSRADGEALLAYVEKIGDEGLDPADYQPERLRSALAGDGAALDAAATDIFLHLAADLREGHVRGPYRIAWHIPDSPIDKASQIAFLLRALEAHRITESLTALLPVHPDYAALKATLAATPTQDKATVEKLRANLERWRWMPRDLGLRYILVNVAGFELQLVENGRIVARHRLIVGKTSTPTPQFSARVTGIILNPWWDVPDSIVAESVGRLVRTNPQRARAQGYVWRGGDIRQAPGPRNSLGQMKLDMPNPFTIYIHDTPSKPLFDRAVRAFSHGCMRVQYPFDLAARLLAGRAGWDRERIDRVVASRVTTRVELAEPLPVYVTYFTAATDDAGKLVLHPDTYHRDAAIVSQLTDREGDGAVEGAYGKSLTSGRSECSADPATS